MESNIVEMDHPRSTAVAVTGTTPADLLRMAVERGADMAQIEKFMDLKDRFDANEARKAFVVAMAEFKKNAPTILKDKNVTFTGTSYSHATLGGICEVVISSLAEHGFSHDWDTVQPDSGMIEVTCIITHLMGHSKRTTMKAPPDNSGKKNAIQQIASTVTYLQRYTLLGACGLATSDTPDDDGRGGAPDGKAPVGGIKTPMKIGANGLASAIEAIKKGEFTVARLKAEYILTEDQLTQVNDEVKNA
jgi:hypothetical protein